MSNSKITVKGIVQGVGFRPFVYRMAKRFRIEGYVINTPEGVLIMAQGKNVSDFLLALQTELPLNARIDALESVECPLERYKGFEIRESLEGEARTAIPLDTAVCPNCILEMFDPSDRRYRYPFINCTDCGPRYTIIQIPPYDRVRTSMKHFAMCPECEAEYRDPSSRRYHAEPISCPHCGPKLSFLTTADELSPSTCVNTEFPSAGGSRTAEPCLNNSHFVEAEGDPIDLAVQMLKTGKIIALKGLGGFHLLCNATDDRAVGELRERKRRKAKPLAVMFKDMEQLERYVSATKEEKILLNGPIKPIVIVKEREESPLSREVAPGLTRIGAFLPYTPLHLLLLETLDFPVVATSANLSDEPIIIRSEEIIERMGHVVDGILDHDRVIVNAMDDSVVQFAGDKPLVLRMGRGYAPLSIPVASPFETPVLAVGAHQKSAVAIGVGNNMILGPHIGDLGSVEADDYFERSIRTFERFYQAPPAVIIADLHPDYTSTRYARTRMNDVPHVQHHYAHILACMAEYGLNETVVGFAFDGTGYGEDMGLWGGEVLLADARTYERIAHLKPMLLLGGEKAVREPRRAALSLLFEQFSLDEVLESDAPCVRAFLPHEIRQLHHMWTKKLNAPPSTSMGRLFDAVASLGGFIQNLDYEGQSGMLMEEYVNGDTHEPFAIRIENGIIDYSQMIEQIVALPQNETSKTVIANRFIATVVEMVAAIADRYPNHPIVVSGGVFQNRTLMDRLYRRFETRTFYAQRKTPINDGGIALGQLYYQYHQRGTE